MNNNQPDYWPSRIKAINSICYTVCIISILAFLATSVAMIWLPTSREIEWRFMATFTVFFFAAGAIMVVNVSMLQSHKSDNRK